MVTIERCPVCGDLLLERHLHAEDPTTVYGTAVRPTQVVHDDGTVEVEHQSIVTGIEEEEPILVSTPPPPREWQCAVPGCEVDPHWKILSSSSQTGHACKFHLGDALEFMGSEAGEPFIVQRISFLTTDLLEEDRAEEEGRSRAAD